MNIHTTDTTTDTALDAARRAILTALRIHGGRLSFAAMLDGGVLLPDGMPIPFNLAGRACRSLNRDGLIVRRVHRRAFVWQLVTEDAAS
ncbi:hypothetical protein [Rhodococcus sp. B50]|uniref:hypothetical protein n=1 Tax=Rhodococcus sp. B50 TaxID=2682847 RepID=UPI0019DD1F24|nr:hypothetical protein [Rhodococcus sp. B50]MBS9373616.1 hypothetical protein [Rhodococcus sp. B50]